MSSISDSSGGLRETLINCDVNYELKKHYLIIGKRDCGKTNFIINNLYEEMCKKIENIYLFTKKENFKYYEKMTDKICDIKNIDLILTEVLKYDGGSKITNNLVIIDDISINFKNNTIVDLFLNARNYGTTLIVSCHYALGIPPDVRVQFDYIITAHDDNHSNIQRLYEHYYGFYPTLKMFNEVLNCLEQYEFLVLQLRYKKNRVSVQKTKIQSEYKFIESKHNIEEIEKNALVKKFKDAKNIINELNFTIDNLVSIRDRLKKLNL